MADTLTDNFRLTKISRRKGWAEAMNENIDRLGKLFCIDNDGNFWFVQNAIYNPVPNTWSQPDTSVVSIGMKMDTSGAVMMLSCAAGNSAITWVNDISNTIPPGAIILWSGTVANIPSGWALCNGMNNTPDLTDKFVVGAGATYAVNATGGEDTHTLTISEMPNHSHQVYTSYGNGASDITIFNVNTYSNIYPAGTKNTLAVGGGSAHNNMPPYYALCYIMKL